MDDEIKVLFSEEQIQTRIAELAKEIKAAYKENEDIYVVCVLSGAFMFCADLVKRLGKNIIVKFVKINSYGNAKKSSGTFINTDINLDNLDGKNVLVVEDIVDTGRSMHFLKETLESKFKLKSFKIATLLDKKCMRKIEVPTDFVGFEIDNKFVLGYGLDYEDKLRNLTYVGYYEKDSNITTD